MSSPEYVEELKVSNPNPLNPEYRIHWTMKWDRKTKTFSVKFNPSFWSNYPDKDVKVVVDGFTISKKDADIRHLQELLSEIALTGDLA